MKKNLFFDNASTTRCYEPVLQALQQFTCEDYGNPSSNHAFGQRAASAIRKARLYFSDLFKVTPDQVIFTGGGTEADNLAIYGTLLPLIKREQNLEILTSPVEHPAVLKTIQSTEDLGVTPRMVPVDTQGRLDSQAFTNAITPHTFLVSIMRVNNIMGATFPVHELAAQAKKINPNLIFHTDAVQAFGRVDIPDSSTAVDLVSISAHKVGGPKGIGALIVLNKDLLQRKRLRPLIWGGSQEGGFRSGTQNAGLISGFHIATEITLAQRAAYTEKTLALRTLFKNELEKRGLLCPPHQPLKGLLHWNSPEHAVPHIINMSLCGYPSGPLAKLLEERGCLVSTGSACSSSKVEPDYVLQAMGYPSLIFNSAIRISLSDTLQSEDIMTLAEGLDQSIQLMKRLLGDGSSRP